MKWSFFLVAMLAGAAMAIQGTMNSALGKTIGLWGSTLVVHVTGLAVVILVGLVIGGAFQGLSHWVQAPWYVYLGGALNVLIIFAVVRSMPKIGVGNATTGIILAQILTAVMIDRFGLMGMQRYPFRLIDILGIGLMVAGTRILLKA